jgi:hypothetical protein
LFQAEGPEVALVTNQNKAELRKVALGHDFGNTIQILTGVTTADSVVANPPDSLTTGTLVSVQKGN